MLFVASRPVVTDFDRFTQAPLVSNYFFSVISDERSGEICYQPFTPFRRLQIEQDQLDL
jgi:hypothetical protein